jgi:putative spermidine/putrescine transport system permease protein/spermidine/putrescine transport system permease protein
MFVFVLLYGPILVSATSSFFSIERGSINWNTFGVSAYVKLANNASILSAVTNTLLVGTISVVLSAALGTGLALYYAYGNARGRDVLQFLIFLPFLMPPIVTGLSLLIFFREIDVPRSLITVTVGHVLFVLAIAYRILLTRVQSMSRSLIEASYDLGATGWQTFIFVILPNLKSALIGAGALAFALSFDETMITVLLTGTENTLPVRLWAMMRTGFTPDINALVTVILCVTTMLCLGIGRYLMPNNLSGAEE